jgi:Cellulase (glycosyl hydrolase family 5)
VRLTRRELARRSLAAAAFGGTAQWWACDDDEDERPAPVGMRKCLSMASIAHGGDPEDLTVGNNLERVLQTGATWVRIWIRWDKAQPVPPTQLPAQLESAANDIPGCGTGCGYRYVESIDRQVAAAHDAGLGVILAAWNFPAWATGALGQPADWERQDRGTARTPVERLKPIEYRVPVGQLGPSGYYGLWLDWLIGRYARYGRRLALEIMNEPNHQLWPQRDAAGQLVIGQYVAEMFLTAHAVSWRHGHPILLAGPALSDRSGADSRLMTNFETLVPDILGWLDLLGFPDAPNFVWTHHNYRDVENDVSSRTAAERVRAHLLGRWRGRGGPSEPAIWLTEGGARLGSGEAVDLDTQAALVRRNWDRMRALPGIELWTNYLLYANPVTDSGLRHSRESGGAPRPVWNVFRSLRG